MGIDATTKLAPQGDGAGVKAHTGSEMIATHAPTAATEKRITTGTIDMTGIGTVAEIVETAWTADLHQIVMIDEIGGDKVTIYFGNSAYNPGY